MSAPSPRLTVLPAVLADRDEIRDLVSASSLPLDGLDDHIGDAFVMRQGSDLMGCAVVEPYPPFALLRSVAIAPDGRSRGAGTTLVEEVLARARHLKFGEVFLLTETAAPFFARLGFLPVARAAVPPEVQASLEFSSVCPTSAQAMAHGLTSSADESGPTARAATASDAEALVAIYNEGIEDRVATFETRQRSVEDVRAWFDGRHPTCVVEAGPPAGRRLVAFASTSSYRSRECYAGIGEFSVYVARGERGQGFGRAAMEGLIEASVRAGFWKLLSRVFVENTASRRLSASLGFREVGIYDRHAQLDGEWRDVVIVERHLGP